MPCWLWSCEFKLSGLWRRAIMLRHHTKQPCVVWVLLCLVAPLLLWSSSNKPEEEEVSPYLLESTDFDVERYGIACALSLVTTIVWFAAHISEHPNQQPSHKIQITMGSTEARVDYMGSSILMGVFSNADLQLQDEWKVNLCTVDTSLSEKRCGMMSPWLHCSAQHDQYSTFRWVMFSAIYSFHSCGHQRLACFTSPCLCTLKCRCFLYKEVCIQFLKCWNTKHTN